MSRTWWAWRDSCGERGGSLAQPSQARKLVGLVVRTLEKGVLNVIGSLIIDFFVTAMVLLDSEPATTNELNTKCNSVTDCRKLTAANQSQTVKSNNLPLTGSRHLGYPRL